MKQRLGHHNSIKAALRIISPHLGCLILTVLGNPFVIGDVNANTALPLPIDVTVVTIELKYPMRVFSQKYSIPTMEVAIASANEIYDGRIRFHFVAGDGSCDRDVVGVSAAKISCDHNISVFVGPSCSRAAETIGYMAADWNVPIISPNGNAGNTGDKTLFPTLTRLNPYSPSSITDTILMVLDKYQWTNLAIFYDSTEEKDELLHLTISERLKNSKFTSQEYPIRGKNLNRSALKKNVQDAATRARVFILIAEEPLVYQAFWQVALELQYSNSSEFVWLVTQDISYAPTANNTWKVDANLTDIIKPSLAQALFFYIDTRPEQIPELLGLLLKIKAIVDDGFTYAGERPSSALLGYWDATLIYAQVVNETLEDGGDPYDGLALSKRMWNRTYDGLAGPISINENGDRDSDVTIAAINPETGMFEDYAIMQSNLSQIVFTSFDSFPWPYNGGEPPPNEPVCGYTGAKCRINTSKENSKLVTAVIIVASVILLIGGVLSIIFFRRWKKQSESDLWWWKIDPSDLRMTERRAYSILSVTSRADVNSMLSPKDGTLVVYKGQIVRVKKLNVKNTKLSQSILNDFKVMRETSHNNLVRLYGACIEDSNMSIVTEHCPKGTLQDLLGNNHISLDAQFKFSLCTDIIDGLAYLHGSAIKCHGRLNSEACWVDNRFSVKLTNFGLPTVYECVHPDIMYEGFINDGLWRAPELLRSCDVRGSKEGDVYSFGIILSEVISRENPFSKETIYMSMEDVINRILKPSINPFRPIIEVPPRLTDMKKLMEKCWNEEPKQRPSVQAVKSELKRIATELGETGNLLDNLLRRMEQYANNLEKLVEEKTVELRDEKKRSEELLYQILPRQVADRLKAGLRVEPEEFDSVTIYFSDIVGFTVISASSTPFQIVDLLNDLYTYFDAIVEEFDVYKVETIGDAYMVVSGLPQRNGNLHAVHIARMSLKLLQGINSFQIRHKPDEKIKLRIGLHSGPVCAGVVGLKMPRYCLFGDTVNTASRMESHGEALKIHISDDCKQILDQNGPFQTTLRGETNIKGKGIMSTYWLTEEITFSENRMVPVGI